MNEIVHGISTFLVFLVTRKQWKELWYMRPNQLKIPMVQFREKDIWEDILTHIWICQKINAQKIMWQWKRTKYFAAATFVIIRNTEIKIAKSNIIKQFFIIIIFCNSWFFQFSWPYQWWSGSVLKIERWEGPGSNPGRAVDLAVRSFP